MTERHEEIDIELDNNDEIDDEDERRSESPDSGRFTSNAVSMPHSVESTSRRDSLWLDLGVGGSLSNTPEMYRRSSVSNRSQSIPNNFSDQSSQQVSQQRFG